MLASPVIPAAKSQPLDSRGPQRFEMPRISMAGTFAALRPRAMWQNLPSIRPGRRARLRGAGGFVRRGNASDRDAVHRREALPTEAERPAPGRSAPSPRCVRRAVASAACRSRGASRSHRLRRRRASPISAPPSNAADSPALTTRPTVVAASAAASAQTLRPDRCRSRGPSRPPGPPEGQLGLDRADE